MPTNPYFDDSDDPTPGDGWGAGEGFWVEPETPSPTVPAADGNLPSPAVPAAPGRPGRPGRPNKPQPAAAQPQRETQPEPWPQPEPRREPEPEPWPQPEPRREPEPAAAQPAPTPRHEPEPEPRPQPQPGNTQPRKLNLTPQTFTRRRNKTPDQETDPTPPAGKKIHTPGRGAGGRWKLIALRALIWTVLAVIAIGGIKNIIAPPQTTVEEVTAGVKTELGINGFPFEGGEAYASRFTTTYLTLNPDQPGQRDEQLETYLPTGQTSGASWIGGTETVTSQTQTVTSGPFLTQPPELVDETCNTTTAPCRATYTFAAQTQTSSPGQPPQQRWTYLTVPVVAYQGGYAIPEAPAFVPAQGQSPQGAPLPLDEDEDATQNIEPTLEEFFKTWAIGNWDSNETLRRLVPPDATPETKTGLGGAYIYNTITNIEVEKLPDGAPADTPRFAVAAVTWNTPAGNYTQNYRLQVSQRDENRWYILDIQGGGFGTTGDTAP